jgi:hypothetical protein
MLHSLMAAAVSLRCSDKVAQPVGKSMYTVIGNECNLWAFELILTSSVTVLVLVVSTDDRRGHSTGHGDGEGVFQALTHVGVGGIAGNERQAGFEGCVLYNRL